MISRLSMTFIEKKKRKKKIFVKKVFSSGAVDEPSLQRLTLDTTDLAACNFRFLDGFPLNSMRAIRKKKNFSKSRFPRSKSLAPMTARQSHREQLG
jgi:hypothetical protein